MSLTCHQSPFLLHPKFPSLQFPVMKQRRVTPEKVRQILKKEKVEISDEEAIYLLDILYNLANLSIKQVLKNFKTSTRK